jgi:hypothetical protein
LTFATSWDGAKELAVESDSYQPERRGRVITGGTVDVGPRSVVVVRKA